MMMLTKQQIEELKANGIETARTGEGDHKPVVKWFGFSSMTFLFTEIDPENDDLIFGLADLGMGFPEMGWNSISELTSVSRGGMKLERDMYFKADKVLSEYAADARAEGRIKT